MAQTERLDRLLVSRGRFPSRERAKRAIMSGAVMVDGQRVDKPGAVVSETAEITLLAAREPYVSRGGRKLEFALQHFELSVDGMVCLDIGASTGGFTDCLLQHGAKHVVAVDVGYGQLDLGLREDRRVQVLERINARYIDQVELPQDIDLVTVDVSFISVVKIVPSLLRQLRARAQMLVLIKPQFEAGRSQVAKGGVIRDEAVRRQVVAGVVARLEALGLEKQGVADSPVRGAKSGNRESFALFVVK